MTPKPSPAPIVETARLRLRGHRPEDLEEMVGLWGDPAVTRYISRRPFDREAVWARLLRYVGHWTLLGYGFWAVEERESGRFAGEVGLAEFCRTIEPSLDAPEVGWVIAPWCHGLGYATEAVSAALQWGERERGFAETCCIIDPDNIRSIAVAGRCDFQLSRRAAERGEASVDIYRRTAKNMR
jgi:RimJ/RimL family protein N-acetyltransferase